MPAEIPVRLAAFLAAEGRRFRARKFRAAFRDLAVPERAALAPAVCAGLHALAPADRLLARRRIRADAVARAGCALALGARLLAADLDESALAAALGRPRALDPALLDDLAAELRATPHDARLHPRWLHAFFTERFGVASAAACLDFHNRPADQHLLLRDPADGDGIAAECARIAGAPAEPLAPGLLRLPVPPLAVDLETLPCVRAGRAVPASVPAAALGEALAGDGAALDLCAAPGGKSAALLLRGQRGPLIAGDRTLAKAVTLAENLARLGGRPPVAVHCGTAPPYREGAFALVLVDAPCSGTGLLRRRPELRGRLKPADLARNLPLQRALLHAAAPLVAPGGRLVYATCSLHRAENEGQVDAFLARNPRFRPAATPTGPTAGRFRFRARETVTPHGHGLDGFFFAILENAR